MSLIEYRASVVSNNNWQEMNQRLPMIAIIDGEASPRDDADGAVGRCRIEAWCRVWQRRCELEGGEEFEDMFHA